MNSIAFLFGVLPLVAFVVIDSFLGFKKGLISAIIFAVLELVYTLYSFGTIDFVTGLSVSLVIIMSFFAWKKDSEKLFLLQPVIMSAFLGSFFIITYFFFEPILLTIIFKYGKNLMPSEQYTLMTSPQMIRLLSASTLTGGFALFAHAFTTWYAAEKLNKWWWLTIRGIGFYLFMFISFIAARFII